MWLDVASIVFVCVTANHLGLVSTIEHFMGKELIVLNCPKCCSFWLTLAYNLWGIHSFYGEFPVVLAISFLASYIALWLELIEGFIDTLYIRLYEKIYANNKDYAPASDTSNGRSASTLSDVR